LEISTDILWKDLIVFLVLRELVTTPVKGLEDLPERLVFKGGTSLSKCYRLVKRFSEDVDLAFINSKGQDYLGQGKRRSYLKAIESFVESLPFITSMEPIDKTEGKRISLFEYENPEAFSALETNPYLKSGIQLEMDFRTDPIPNCKKYVGSLIGDYLRKHSTETYNKYPLAEFEIKALELQRTLVEKTLAVISTLTQLNADSEKGKKDKLKLEEKERHFYDIARLWAHFCRLSEREKSHILSKEELQDLFKRSIDLDEKYGTRNYETSIPNSLPIFSKARDLLGDDKFQRDYKRIFSASPLYFPHAKPDPDNVLKEVAEYFDFLTETLKT
jgi:hypothetical protein